MTFEWNPFGVVGLLAMVLACGMGWFVYFTRSDRPQNRRLALVLQLGGVSAGFYFGVAVMGGNADTARWAIEIGMTLLLASPAAYLFFVATVNSPLARPLQSKTALALMVAYVVVVEAFWFADPGFFIGDQLAHYSRVSGWHVDFLQPLIGGRVFGGGMLALAELYGLIVAISAYRNASNPMSKDRALIFAIAFGFRDLFGAAFVIYFTALDGFFRPHGDVLFILTVPVVDLFFYSLLTYGILKSQLFDIDLRLKGGLRHSIAALPYAVVFLVAQEAVERFVLLPFDSFWAGLLAAGSIVVLMRPIQTQADAIADKILPGIDRSAGYLESRKDEVYRHALESFYEDGIITSHERKALERLSADLGIDARRARAIEDSVTMALAGGDALPA
jgi:hypothetical protein